MGSAEEIASKLASCMPLAAWIPPEFLRRREADKHTTRVVFWRVYWKYPGRASHRLKRVTCFPLLKQIWNRGGELAPARLFTR